MAYNYYCTHCGRELRQETVLFNMEPLLVGSVKKEDALRQIQFRLTLAELQGLIMSGQPVDMGYRRCAITLPTLMKCIANPNNMNDPAIAGLTMADIEEYTKIDIQAAGEAQNKEEDSFGLDGLAFGFIDDEPEKKEEPVKETPKKETKLSPAILALESKNIKNADRAYLKDNLAQDLNVLKNLFAGDKPFFFDIQLKTEMDNQGQPVIVGYRIQSGWPRHTTDVSARVCLYCSRPLFEYAGTAPHQAIAFIGGQKTGKTCTMLALAHYLENGLLKNLGNPIWGTSEAISSVATIELLSNSEELEKDLKNYAIGIPPDKTDANKREDAYSVTFRVRNKHEQKYYILTLTDVPGELCNEEKGTIDTSKIMDEFPVALNCHAYILCFDANKAAQDGKAMKMTTNVCKWADEFQKLRYQREEAIPGHVPGFAPIVVLYTKCVELENPPAEGAKTYNVGFDLVKRAYMFHYEGLCIDDNPIYAFVGEQLRQYDSLKKSYQARLRVSPIGFRAPARDDDDFDPNNLRIPEPKQIDKLMRWILEISGCIPTDAAYQPNLQSNQTIRPEKNFITRVQYRHENPGKGGSEDERFKEGLARVHLFENPGYFDDGYVRNYKSVMAKKIRLEEKLGKRNDN